jgi:DNA invertase Pin-like site-specific DNA recombinase
MLSNTNKNRANAPFLHGNKIRALFPEKQYKCEVRTCSEDYSMTKALAYLRTSSAANVGGDSDKRQRHAIGAYAVSNGIEIVGEFYDVAVSGADLIEVRAGFSAMLDRIEENGVRVVIVEDASRFARELLVQEMGIIALIKRDVKLYTANGEELTDTTDPMRKMFRQITGSFHEYEKDRLVRKLRAARDRKAGATGKRVEGRKSVATRRPEVGYAVKEMRGRGMTLRAITDALEARGVLTTKQTPFQLAQVARIVREVVP